MPRPRGHLILLAFIALVLGCSTPSQLELPPERRIERPTPCFSRAPLPADEKVVVDNYPFAHLSKERTAELEELLRLALPNGAWSTLTGVERYGGQLAIAQTPSAHARIKLLLEAVKRSGSQPMTLAVNGFELPWETVASLGPLTLSQGAEGEDPFFAVQVSSYGHRHLRQLVETGEAGELFLPQRLDAKSGRFMEFSTGTRRAYLGGLAFTADPLVEVIANPQVETAEAKVSIRAACVPVKEGTLLVVRASDASLLWSPSLPSRSGRFTSVTVELPAKLERATSEAATLAPGHSLLLVGASGRAGIARAILLSPLSRRQGISDTKWSPRPDGSRAI